MLSQDGMNVGLLTYQRAGIAFLLIMLFAFVAAPGITVAMDAPCGTECMFDGGADDQPEKELNPEVYQPRSMQAEVTQPLSLHELNNSIEGLPIPTPPPER